MKNKNKRAILNEAMRHLYTQGCNLNSEVLLFLYVWKREAILSQKMVSVMSHKNVTKHYKKRVTSFP